MRIAQLIDTLKWGGAQKMQILLAQTLAERDMPLTVISLDAPQSNSLADQLCTLGALVVHIPGKLRSFSRFRKLQDFLHRGQFDVMQSQLSYANILGPLAGRLAGVPVVASLRSAGIDMRHYHPVRHRLESLVLRFVPQRVMSNSYAGALAHRRRLGGRRIDVLPNAIDMPPEYSESERRAVRAELMGDPNQMLIISVGRLAPPKGYTDLIQAFSMIHPHFPQAFLAIVGGGNLQASLQNQIDSLNLSSHILLTGQRSDVPRLLAAGELFVNASHWEGMSVAVLEAMAAGLPVIASNVGDTARVLASGTGLIVPPRQPDELAAAMLELLGDPNRRAKMGRQARLHVQRNYNLQAWTERLLALYKEVATQ